MTYPRSRTMLRPWNAMVLAAALAPARTALASPEADGPQAATHLAALQVDVWPEYDRPAALVILRFRLAAETTLPATIHVALPEGAQEPHAVAVRGEDGNLYLAPHRLLHTPAGRTVAITCNRPEGQLEYYAPIERTGGERRFAWSWPAGLEAETLLYVAQEPKGAEGFAVSPPPDESFVGADGLRYHKARLVPPRDAGVLVFELGYRKSDDGLSKPVADAIVPTEVAPPPPARRASGPPGDTWFYFAAGAVVLLIGVLVWRGTRG